jgi:hypothetical protein
MALGIICSHALPARSHVMFKAMETDETEGQEKQKSLNPNTWEMITAGGLLEKGIEEQEGHG